MMPFDVFVRGLIKTVFAASMMATVGALAVLSCSEPAEPVAPVEGNATYGFRESGDSPSLFMRAEDNTLVLTESSSAASWKIGLYNVDGTPAIPLASWDLTTLRICGPVSGKCVDFADLKDQGWIVRKVD